jgi:uncharacterized protein
MWPSCLKKIPAARRTYPISTSAITHLADFELVAPLVGQVEFLRTGQDILVEGTFEATIEKACGRCLAPFTASVAVEIEEIFYPSLDLISGNPLPPPPDADEANRIDEQHILDLYEVVRQALLLDSESVRYCRRIAKDCVRIVVGIKMLIPAPAKMRLLMPVGQGCCLYKQKNNNGTGQIWR